jgi:hypothetical protein
MSETTETITATQRASHYWQAAKSWVITTLKTIIGVCVSTLKKIPTLAKDLIHQPKQDFHSELKSAYESMNGKGSLWFSGPGTLNFQEGESERRYIVRRFAANLVGAQAAMQIRRNVRPVREKLIREGKKPAIALGAALGLAATINFDSTFVTVAAIIAIAIACLALVASFANFDYRHILPFLINNVHQNANEAAAQALSETLIRASAKDAPADLRDYYRLPLVDVHGEPVSNRLIETDIQADFFEEEIKAAAFNLKARFFRNLMAWATGALGVAYVAGEVIAGLVRGLMAYLATPATETASSGEGGWMALLSNDAIQNAMGSAFTMGGWVETLLIAGAISGVAYFVSTAWGIMWAMEKTGGKTTLGRRPAILAALAEKSIDQIAQQSGVRAALMQEDRALEQQIALAKQDPTPFFELGRSTGFLRDRYDMFAPSEAGMPVGITFNDLSTHLIVLGGTGAGKTSGTIRPLIKQWLDASQGGLLVLDGKGQLPAEIEDPDYQLIDPATITINPIEGLSPDDVADTLLDLADDSDSSQADPYWANAAAKLVRSAAHAATALQEKGAGSYTLAQIYRLAATESGREKASEVITDKDLESFTGARRRGVEYLLLEFSKLPEKQRGSIEGIAGLWLSQITDNEKLEAWAEAETGFAIEAVTEGARVGVLLPESRYGKAGALVAGLLKKRVYEAIKRRGDDWQNTPGQKPVLVVIDEIQELLTGDETSMLPVARSLGLYAAFATQNVDGIINKLGENAGYQLLGNLRSMVAYQVQTKLTIEYISERMGASYRPEIHHVDRYEDLNSRLHRTVSQIRVNGEGERYQWDAYGLKNLGRTIGQRVQNLGGNSLGMIIDPQTRKRMMESFSEGQDTDWAAVEHNQARESAEAVENSGLLTQSLAIKPNVTTDEVNELLAKPAAALVQVIRARVPRRDLVDTNPIYTMRQEDQA